MACGPYVASAAPGGLRAACAGPPAAPARSGGARRSCPGRGAARADHEGGNAMIWVSWRQHRSQAITCLGLLGILAVFAIVVSSSMRTAFSHDQLAGCLAHNPVTGACQGAVGAFMTSFNTVVNIGFWALLLAFPGLIGVVIGAPLIARELEYGTWQLAWAQTVPRTRCLVTTLATVTAGLAILGAAVTAPITCYRHPLDPPTRPLPTTLYA